MQIIREDGAAALSSGETDMAEFIVIATLMWFGAISVLLAYLCGV
jgi:hypothetical protein